MEVADFKKMNEKIWLITLGILILILGLFVGYGFAMDEKEFKVTTSFEVSEYNQCINLSLYKTSECLRDWLETFYNYTVRDETKYHGTDGSLEDVKKNGGDCFDYSQVYKNALNELGFKTRIEKIYSIDLNKGHTFLIAWNQNLTEYCIIDQLIINCQEMISLR